MYEAVHAYPDGDSTVARCVRTAARQGYEGVVVRTREASDAAGAAGSRGDASGPSFDTIRDEYRIDVVAGAEIVADDPASAGGSVGNFRPDYVVLAVRGGDAALNRFAVESDRVDVLSRPMAGGGDVNHVIAKAARDHGVRIEFDFGPVLRATGGPRVRALSDLRKLREIVDHYDAPFVVSANAASHLQLRAPRELRAVGEAIGFSPSQVEAGLAEWAEIVETNRHRLSEEFIAPGVQRGRYDDEREP